MSSNASPVITFVAELQKRFGKAMHAVNRFFRDWEAICADMKRLVDPKLLLNSIGQKVKGTGQKNWVVNINFCTTMSMSVLDWRGETCVGGIFERRGILQNS